MVQSRSQLSGRPFGSLYVLFDQIGAGATGAVFRGAIVESGEPIAAKLLRREFLDDEQIVMRFVQERSILTSLTHPNLVRVRDMLFEGGELAIVMDLVEGSDLRNLLAAEQTLTPSLATRLTTQVLDALAVAHRADVLHRDVKPENVLLDVSGTEPAAKLSDFGIARLVSGSASRMSQMIGTPNYMSPEVIVAEVLSPAQDVYAAGIMLYELLTGFTPFGGSGNPYAVQRRHVESTPPQVPGIPSALWPLLSQMLAKDPSARPSAEGAAAQLRSLAGALTDLPASAPAEAPSEWTAFGGRVHQTAAVTNVRGQQAPEPELADPAPAVPGLLQPSNENATSVQERAFWSRPARPEDLIETIESPPERQSRAPLLAAVAIVCIALVVAGALAFGGRASKDRLADKAGAVGSARLESSLGVVTTARQFRFSKDRSFVEATLEVKATNNPDSSEVKVQERIPTALLSGGVIQWLVGKDWKDISETQTGSISLAPDSAGDDIRYVLALSREDDFAGKFKYRAGLPTNVSRDLDITKLPTMAHAELNETREKVGKAKDIPTELLLQSVDRLKFSLFPDPIQPATVEDPVWIGLRVTVSGSENDPGFDLIPAGIETSASLKRQYLGAVPTLGFDEDGCQPLEKRRFRLKSSSSSGDYPCIIEGQFLDLPLTPLSLTVAG